MGTLRLIFALAVVCAHSWPGGPLSVGGENAVRLFYMISGFLISFILTEQKSYGSVGRFYLNRYLRLYPTYLAVALLSLAFNWHALMDLYRQLPTSANLLLAFSNLFIFGQDWVMFAGVKHGALTLLADFRHSDLPLYKGLFIEQAWTLGLELTFYAIAPFVLPRRWLLWILLGLSLGVRLVIIMFGWWDFDPWSYRFFPAELSIFLLGSLAHQIGLPLYRSMPEIRRNRLARWATFGFAVFCLIYSFLTVPKAVLIPVLLLLFLPVLPLTFIFQNNTKWDRWLGNLSYPLYICHVLVIGMVEYFAPKASDPYLMFLIVIMASLAFSYALDQLIVEPFEKVRTFVRQRASARGKVLERA
jgi:peptidoglycan/LPS O-acetylase OafA/YrhL